MSSGESSSFYLLDERIQRFIWEKGWESLRDAQEAAIPAILPGKQDVIIAAATAAGKTEAAFLPALTNLLAAPEPGLIVYISPLKALINDQFGRLQELCERLDIPVWPWHGDIANSRKQAFMAKRYGVLLITPESLEAQMCNRGTSLGATFQHLAFIVIDELHAFIGVERGKQLQSQLHRIEKVVSRSVPRIGLSATLGDPDLAASFLRPGHGRDVVQIRSGASGNELMVQVRGYEEPLVIDLKEIDEEREPTTPGQVAAHLFRNLRGTNNLIFPNSRREVERYTHQLNKLCAANSVPNEFWPHHGNLSPEIRGDTEAALKQKEVPATAICTNTLELGIDIGAVKSVAQVGSPPSVASLRQRLGRSGRRKGEPAILRGYCIEDEVGPNASLADELRLGTVQTIAMISLLVEPWAEPPMVGGVHVSTLIQQMLSVIAQYGGATIGQLYGLLCGANAPFEGVSKEEFSGLVRHLGAQELVTQDSSGLLLHGPKGERIVNHYAFFAAFATDEEFRLVTKGRQLGTIPVAQMLIVGQRILFAGKTWRVDDVDEAQKTIFVTRTSGGVPPLFSGGAGRTHTRVRQRMRELLEGNEVPLYLDDVAKKFLAQGRQAYLMRSLSTSNLLDQGGTAMLLTWMGDAANEALACLFHSRGYVASCSGPGVEIVRGQNSHSDLHELLVRLAQEPVPSLDDLLADVKNIRREKWDWAVPDGLLRRSYASLSLAIPEAWAWLSAFGRF